MADMADAPGGGSLAFTAPSLQLSMRCDGKTAQSMLFRAHELGACLTNDAPAAADPQRHLLAILSLT